MLGAPLSASQRESWTGSVLFVPREILPCSLISSACFVKLATVIPWKPWCSDDLSNCRIPAKMATAAARGRKTFKKWRELAWVARGGAFFLARMASRSPAGGDWEAIALRIKTSKFCTPSNQRRSSGSLRSSFRASEKPDPHHPLRLGGRIAKSVWLLQLSLMKVRGF